MENVIGHVLRNILVKYTFAFLILFQIALVSSSVMALTCTDVFVQKKPSQDFDKLKQVISLAMILSESPSRPSDPENLKEIARLVTLAKQMGGLKADIEIFESSKIREVVNLAMILSESPSRPNDPDNLKEIRRLMSLAKNLDANPNYVPPVKSDPEPLSFNFWSFIREQRKQSAHNDQEYELLRIEGKRREHISGLEYTKIILKEQWEKIKRRFMSAYLTDFMWRDGYLPKDFNKFPPIGFKNRVPKGSLVEVLMLEDKMTQQEIRSGHSYDNHSGQLITPNSTYDLALLHISGKYEGSPEVLRLRAFDREGRVIGEGPIVVGDSGEVSEEAYYYAANNLTWRGKIFLVEIAHTHPVYEINYYFLKASKFMYSGRRNPLSYGDMEMQHRESLRWDVPVRVKAVLPNGYSYNMTMENGREIPDPLIEK